MRVLLLGPTGNLGQRLLPLLANDHTLHLYTRTPSKLHSLLSSSPSTSTDPSTPSASLLETCTIITGDAKDSHAITTAILDYEIDIVINCAGVAKVFPWQKGELNEIFGAVMKAVAEVGEVRRVAVGGSGSGSGRALRLWVMGGMGVLRYPGEEGGMLSD